LQNAGGLWGALTWGYDGTGNRTSEVLTSTTTTSVLGYPSGNNRLASVTQGSTTVRAFTYDGAGNITQDVRSGVTQTYTYNNRGRLASASVGGSPVADYSYDALERLTFRTVQGMSGPVTTHYAYDLAGRVIAETASTVREYIWLDDMPVAMVDNAAGTPQLYFIHADHLDRPVMMTDASKTVSYEAVFRPFGELQSLPTGTATINLRFPGQYQLAETGLAHNWHRQYDASIGRYIQPDPLGFVDGPSVYAYANGAPSEYVDSEGEASRAKILIDALKNISKNLHYEGPNEKFIRSGQGRLCQIRYKDFGVRLDYQEYIRGEGPEYHLNLGRPGKDLHIPLNPKRWFGQ
jgi:RHS repeat-associated protein